MNGKITPNKILVLFLPQVMRKNCEDARRIVVNNRAQHLTQIEQLETENTNSRKKVRSEVNQLEKALTESRKELELLRVE